MFFVIFLLTVFRQRAEHRVVFHIMTVDNGMQIRTIGGVSVINKKRSRYIPSTVKQSAKIILVILALYYRIVDFGIRAIEPSNNVLVFFLQTLKVYRNWCSFRNRLYRRFCLSILRLLCLWCGFYRFINQHIILSLTVLCFFPIIINVICR